MITPNKNPFHHRTCGSHLPLPEQIAPTMPAVRSQNPSPSHVLPGLSQGISLCFPSARPPK